MFQLPKNLNDLRATWRFANSIAPKSPSGAYTVNKSATAVDFYVYDIIGAYDDDAESFVKAVRDTAGKPINLHINSPGGFVWDAVAMYDSLSNSSSEVSVSIEGLAASAASFLAMAASPGMLRISEPGRMMIHDAQGIGIGSPAEMQEYTDMLHNTSNDISKIYAKRAGGDPKAWRKAMTATTWYSSEQAVSAKLADSVTKPQNSKGPDNRTRIIQARHKVLVKG